MPTELIAPAREEVAFRQYDSPPLAPDQVRVRSRFGAAKHGSEMAMFQGYAGHRGNYDGDLHIFTQESQMVRYPNGLGNICVGEVIEEGSAVQDISLGETFLNISLLVLKMAGDVA